MRANRPLRMALLLAALAALTGLALAEEFRVVQRNQEFSVRDLQVRVGDRVTFTNGDSVTHNLYSETKGMEFEIELQPPGRSDTITFARPGTVEVRCAIHSAMKLRVDVKP
ncbi:MAG TPA: plastocyanin/azurin family copper-binding protein [Burkholderiales bacterium]|nr:plastocyanin/azurin family copper-binding protein [Burkholderiales bacterium]